jgi:hypothetical protein
MSKDPEYLGMAPVGGASEVQIREVEAPVLAASTLLSRKDSAGYLTSIGYPIAYATLAKLAVHGGGPEFDKWGRHVLYERKKLIEWAASRARHKLSTSDAGER